MKKSTNTTILETVISVVIILLFALSIASRFIGNCFLAEARNAFFYGAMAGCLILFALDSHRKEKKTRVILLIIAIVLLLIVLSLEIAYLIGYLVGLACCVCG